MNKDYHAIIYFDVNLISQASKIQSATLSMEIDGREARAHEVNIYYNELLEQSDKVALQEQAPSMRYRMHKNLSVNADITEAVHALAAGVIENNGMIAKIGTNKIFSCKLHLTYQNDIITYQRGDGFHEEEFVLSSIDYVAASPWILAERSKIVTVYLKNVSPNKITAYLQNSPNAKESIDDPQTLEILPEDTGYLIPQIFSKYIRVCVKSQQSGIVAKVWFQTQLASR